MREPDPEMVAEALTESLVLGTARRYAALPPGALRRDAGRALFDFVVCSAAGLPAVGGALGPSSRSRGPATVVGTGARGTAEDIAALNAAAAHAHDRDDLHWPSLTHPGGVIWPVVLAVGEEVDASGADALAAAVAGYETIARLARALGLEHRRYWHATATAGTVGAAVAAAVAMGIGPSGAATAAGHAISVAGGSIQALIERSGTRIFHRAHAVRTGIAAARAAAGGLATTRFGLEAERGLFAATAPGADPRSLVRDPGSWAIEELTLRLYAATGFAHAAVDAALGLTPVQVRAIRRVTIEAPAPAAALAGIRSPRTREEAWWSIPYAVAVNLVTGRADALEEPGFLADGDVDRLLAVTELVGRPTRVPEDIATTVTVEAEGGEARSATCSAPRGHPARPLSDEELAEKWRALDARIGQEQAEELLLLAGQLDELRVRDLTARLRRSARGSASGIRAKGR